MSRTVQGRHREMGELVEEQVLEGVPEFEQVPDSEAEHYDAVSVCRVDPDCGIPMIGGYVIVQGTPVEIKSALPRYRSGDRGRFYLRQRQHERLLEEDGWYLLSVVDEDRCEISSKLVRAVELDGVVPSWIDGGTGRQAYAQVTWTRVFETEQVEQLLEDIDTSEDGDVDE